MITAEQAVDLVKQFEEQKHSELLSGYDSMIKHQALNGKRMLVMDVEPSEETSFLIEYLFCNDYTLSVEDCKGKQAANAADIARLIIQW